MHRVTCVKGGGDASKRCFSDTIIPRAVSEMQLQIVCFVFFKRIAFLHPSGFSGELYLILAHFQFIGHLVSLEVLGKVLCCQMVMSIIIVNPPPRRISQNVGQPVFTQCHLSPRAWKRTPGGQGGHC